MSQELLLHVSDEEAADIIGGAGATYGFSYTQGSSPFNGQFAVNGYNFAYNYNPGQNGSFKFANLSSGQSYNIAWNGTGAPSYSAS